MTKTKYHINYKGEAGKCTAVAGGCPFGEESDHYPTADAARAAYEKAAGATFSEDLPQFEQVTATKLKKWKESYYNYRSSDLRSYVNQALDIGFQGSDRKLAMAKIQEGFDNLYARRYSAYPSTAISAREDYMQATKDFNRFGFQDIRSIDEVAFDENLPTYSELNYDSFTAEDLNNLEAALAKTPDQWTSEEMELINSAGVSKHGYFNYSPRDPVDAKDVVSDYINERDLTSLLKRYEALDPELKESIGGEDVLRSNFRKNHNYSGADLDGYNESADRIKEKIAEDRETVLANAKIEAVFQQKAEDYQASKAEAALPAVEEA